MCTFHGFAQEISKELSDFNAVKVFHGMEVVLVPSDTNKIVITGHSKKDVTYEIKDNRLELKLSLDNIWSENNTLVTVYFDAIETIDVNEGALVSVKGELKADNPTFRVQEGASLTVKVNAKHISAKAITGGKIYIKGKAENQNVEVNTAGQFFGEDLKTKETEISVGTGGKAVIYASQYAKATAKLGGVIHINGDPNKLDTKTSFGGKIL